MKRYFIIILVLVSLMAFIFCACESKPSETDTKKNAEEILQQQQLWTEEFELTLQKLTKLEQLSKAYKASDYKKIMLGYLRKGRYDSFTWKTLAGTPDEGFEDYVATNDEGVNISSIREIDIIKTPKLFEDNDLIHMFGTMSMILTGFGDLGGWAGDIATLAIDLAQHEGTVEELLDISNKEYFNVYGGFDGPDVIADLDAVIFMGLWTADVTLADVMKQYYSVDLSNNYDRVRLYMQYDDIDYDLSKDELRQYIYNRTLNAKALKTFWASEGFSYGDYDPQVLAACYSYADYLYKWTAKIEN